MYNKLVCYIVQIKPIVTISINDDAATSPTNATTQCTIIIFIKTMNYKSHIR